MRHARDANELFEVFGNELRSVVGDDARFGFRELFFGALQENLNIRFAHGLTQTPVHNVTAGTVQHCAQVIKGAVNVDVRDVDVPMLMRCQRLFESCTLFAGLARPRLQATSGMQHMTQDVAIGKSSEQRWKGILDKKSSRDKIRREAGKQGLELTKDGFKAHDRKLDFVKTPEPTER